MTKSGQNEKNSLKRIVTPKTTPPTTARLSPRFPRQSLVDIIIENWIELNQWYFNLVGLRILILNWIERFFLWTWLVWGSSCHWLGCRSPPCPSPVLWKSMNVIWILVNFAILFVKLKGSFFNKKILLPYFPFLLCQSVYAPKSLVLGVQCSYPPKENEVASSWSGCSFSQRKKRTMYRVYDYILMLVILEPFSLSVGQSYIQQIRR